MASSRGDDFCRFNFEKISPIAGKDEGYRRAESTDSFMVCLWHLRNYG